MKTIPEIVDFYNDDKVFITTENRLDFTFSDLKKQIEWTVNFLNNNYIQKSDKNYLKSKNSTPAQDLNVIFIILYFFLLIFSQNIY